MVSAAICLLRSSLRGQYFRVCFCNLDHHCWHYRLHPTKKASRSSKLQDYTSRLFFSQQKVRNERISAVNSRGYFIIYLFLFLHITPEHNLKLSLKSTSLLVLFPLENIAYNDHPILLSLPRDLTE